MKKNRAPSDECGNFSLVPCVGIRASAVLASPCLLGGIWELLVASSSRSIHNPQPLETFRVCAAVTEGFRWLPRGTAEIIPQGLLFKPTGAFTVAWWKSIQMQHGFSLRQMKRPAPCRGEQGTSITQSPAKRMEVIKLKVVLGFEPCSCSCSGKGCSADASDPACACEPKYWLPFLAHHVCLLRHLSGADPAWSKQG